MKKPIHSTNPHHPFGIPDTYFDEMKKQVIDSTRAKGGMTSDNTNRSLIGSVSRYWLPMAASVLILCGIAYGIWQYEASNDVILTQEMEIVYPESTDDLLAFVMEDPNGTTNDQDANLDEFESFLLSLESLEE